MKPQKWWQKGAKFSILRTRGPLNVEIAPLPPTARSSAHLYRGQTPPPHTHRAIGGAAVFWPSAGFPTVVPLWMQHTCCMEPYSPQEPSTATHTRRKCRTKAQRLGGQETRVSIGEGFRSVLDSACLKHRVDGDEAALASQTD